MSDSHSVNDPFDTRYQDVCFYLAQRVPREWTSFAVLTAYNPHGKPVTQVENDHASERLRATLIDRNLAFVRITGSASDDTHEEPGFGLRCDQNEARALARQFEQLAYYWVCNDRLFLEATSESERIDIGSWSTKVRWRSDRSQII